MLFVGLINILHPYLVKTELSRNHIKGEAIARKPAEAPYKKKEKKKKKKKKSNILKSVLQKLTRSKIYLEGCRTQCYEYLMMGLYYFDIMLPFLRR